MSPFFTSRIKELKLRCPDNFSVYITTPGEEPGACPSDELDQSRHAIGTVGDPVEKLYTAWISFIG